MKTNKQKYIESLISKMSLEQMVGQCLVLGYVGTLITPEILSRIRKYTPAGLRTGLYWRMRTAKHDPGCTPPAFAYRMLRTPSGTMKDLVEDIPVPYCTNEEYCHFLNTLKMENLVGKNSIPMHITFDFEGDLSCDYYHGGIYQFPSYMGIARSNDPKMAYYQSYAIGAQLSPIGFSWSHSLVLDVNTNPLNPEIGTRSFGEDAETVINYASEAYKGWKAQGIIATGKHFPGRGASTTDAHSGLPIINLTTREIEEHLRPFKALINMGLPAIMTAHTAYPKIDPSGLPATLSKTFLTDLLKNDMGFKGVVTTDAMAMGGDYIEI